MPCLVRDQQCAYLPDNTTKQTLPFYFFCSNHRDTSIAQLSILSNDLDVLKLSPLSRRPKHQAALCRHSARHSPLCRTSNQFILHLPQESGNPEKLVSLPTERAKHRSWILGGEHLWIARLPLYLLCPIRIEKKRPRTRPVRWPCFAPATATRTKAEA